MCPGCRAFRPEVNTPVDDGAVELCWHCAHHATAHEHRPIETAWQAVCTCSANEIYPAGHAGRGKALPSGEALREMAALDIQREIVEAEQEAAKMAPFRAELQRRDPVRFAPVHAKRRRA